LHSTAQWQKDATPLTRHNDGPARGRNQIDVTMGENE